jgi:hypothetical protein
MLRHRLLTTPARAGWRAMAMEMKLTREQFVAQFPNECNVGKIQDCLFPEKGGTQFNGVEIFRALNLILIRVNGKFYSHN